MPATDPIRDSGELRAMALYYLSRKQYRNYAMLVLGCCTALRISDLLALRWGDVYDFQRGEFRKTFSLTEKKTGKYKTIAVNDQAAEALGKWFQRRPDDGWIFEGTGNSHGRPISRTQAWRIIREAAEAAGVTGHIACHSLRKTFGYHAVVDLDANPAVLMEVYNHSSYEVTRRYLGITEDQTNELYQKLKLF